jgi:hypothetical protein
MIVEEEAGDRLIQLAAVYSRAELHALLALLRTHRIFAVTMGEELARTDTGLVLALGGVRVLIPIRELPLAAELLEGVVLGPWLGPVYVRNRLVDVALMLVLAVLAVPPPPRIPTEFHLAITRRREVG